MIDVNTIDIGVIQKEMPDGWVVMKPEQEMGNPGRWWIYVDQPKLNVHASYFFDIQQSAFDINKAIRDLKRTICVGMARLVLGIPQFPDSNKKIDEEKLWEKLRELSALLRDEDPNGFYLDKMQPMRNHVGEYVDFT